MLPLPVVLAALTTGQIVVLVLVALAVLIAWKFLKFAFRIAVVVLAAAAIFFVLRSANVL